MCTSREPINQRCALFSAPTWYGARPLPAPPPAMHTKGKAGSKPEARTARDVGRAVAAAAAKQFYAYLVPVFLPLAGVCTARPLQGLPRLQQLPCLHLRLGGWAAHRGRPTATCSTIAGVEPAPRCVCRGGWPARDYNSPVTAALHLACQQVRQTAGLLLKNNVRAHYGSIAEDFRAFIKAALLPVLGHASRPLRHTAGTCAVTIVNLTGLGAWPELVATLAEGLDSGADSNRVEGALDLVYKASAGWRGARRGRITAPLHARFHRPRRHRAGSCPAVLSQDPSQHPSSCCFALCGWLPQIAEDQPLQMDAQLPGAGNQRVADVLVPRVLNLLSAPTADLRALAVSTLNQLANIMPGALIDNMDRQVPGQAWGGRQGSSEKGCTRLRSNHSFQARSFQALQPVQPYWRRPFCAIGSWHTGPLSTSCGRPPSPALACCRFLQGLFHLALDSSTSVRKAVCQGLVAMLMAVPERLVASMPDLIEYMLKSTQVRLAWGWACVLVADAAAGCMKSYGHGLHGSLGALLSCRRPAQIIDLTCSAVIACRVPPAG